METFIDSLSTILENAFMPYEIVNADCFAWLAEQEPETIHGVCTDPPYGLVEFSEIEVEKLRQGRGGVWRLPPTIGGSKRDPLPRFTVLSEAERKNLKRVMFQWGQRLFRVLVPGAHVYIAGHPIMQYLVQSALAEAGFEVRPAVLRLYVGFRGGDRPKNAEQEFPEVCVTPKSAYEPWMLFRKPISERTVAENLRRWKTGGLRRLSADKPLPEVIQSGKTPSVEENLADHPCLKPQHFLRILVRSLLPLGEGVIIDPFMGSGSAIAAAEAVGYTSIGVEIDEQYFRVAQHTIPKLAALYPGFDGTGLEHPIHKDDNKADGIEVSHAPAQMSFLTAD